MMEKFLKDYVKMYAESGEIELNPSQITALVNYLMNEDEIWDTLDSYIYDYLEEMEDDE